MRHSGLGLRRPCLVCSPVGACGSGLCPGRAGPWLAPAVTRFLFSLWPPRIKSHSQTFLSKRRGAPGAGWDRLGVGTVPPCLDSSLLRSPGSSQLPSRPTPGFPSPLGFSGRPCEGQGLTWTSAFACSPRRVLTELVSKMRDMQMDKTELGCLRAIVLFNPGTAFPPLLLLSGPGVSPPGGLKAPGPHPRPTAHWRCGVGDLPLPRASVSLLRCGHSHATFFPRPL